MPFFNSISDNSSDRLDGNPTRMASTSPVFLRPRYYEPEPVSSLMAETDRSLDDKELVKVENIDL